MRRTIQWLTGFACVLCAPPLLLLPVSGCVEGASLSGDSLANLLGVAAGVLQSDPNRATDDDDPNDDPNSTRDPNADDPNDDDPNDPNLDPSEPNDDPNRDPNDDSSTDPNDPNKDPNDPNNDPNDDPNDPNDDDGGVGPGEVRLDAALTGSGPASGAADYRVEGTRRKFKLEVEDFAPGAYPVSINGGTVFTLTVGALGTAEIEFDSVAEAGHVPFPPGFPAEIKSGDQVTVGGIVSGTF